MSPLKKSQTKKSLTTRKIKIESDIKVLKEDLKDIEVALYEKKKRLKKIKNELNNINISPTVSEHAILRYLERKHGINIEEIRDNILTGTLTAQINNLHSGKFPIDNGFTAIVRDKCVVSIV